jgi:sulfide:quinone oxidoreductase
MLNVLIAGGGPAALEAALRLDRLARGRVSTTLLAPDTDFTYRPLSVLEPFAAGTAWNYPLARLAADARFIHRVGALARVDPGKHEAYTDRGERIAYDALLVATGARAVPSAGATTFSGTAADAEALHGLVQDVEGGYTRSVAFVLPYGTTWPLPLYELALMLAERAYESNLDVDIQLVSPEPGPLALFGPTASAEVAALLHEAGIEFRAAARDADRVVTLATLEPPRIEGLPDGFLVTDAHGRVAGVPDVFAAGDATAFAIKQGGIACQQADAAAEQIAALAGAPISPERFRPVLRGMLLTERWARFLRRDISGSGDDSAAAGRALWWPPTKIAGRELASYLESLDAELGRVRGRPVEANMSV